MPEPRTDPTRLRRYTFLSLGAGLAVITIFSSGASTQGDFLARFGASVSLTLGAVMVGTLLGFLFGIPRTQQDLSGPSPSADRTTLDIAYQINTNLEQISDWLTKIIIGVGLIELRSIGGWLLSFSAEVGGGFGGNQALATSYVLGLLLFFSLCGFLFGYLWTRLFFGIAVREADEGLVGRLEKWEADARADAQAIALVTRQLHATAGDAGPPEAELQAAVAMATSHTRVKIFYDAWASRREPERLELSIPVFRALIAVDKAAVYHQNHAQLAYALKDKAAPDYEEAEAELSRAIEIRDRRREEGFAIYEANRALCRIHLKREAALIEADLRKAAEDPWVKSWLAEDCAKWLKANGLNPEELGLAD